MQDFNSAHNRNEFWKNFKKVFSNVRDTMIAPLKFEKGLCFTATEENRCIHRQRCRRKTSE